MIEIFFLLGFIRQTLEDAIQQVILEQSKAHKYHCYAPWNRHNANCMFYLNHSNLTELQTWGNTRLMEGTKNSMSQNNLHLSPKYNQIKGHQTIILTFESNLRCYSSIKPLQREIKAFFPPVSRLLKTLTFPPPLLGLCLKISRLLKNSGTCPEISSMCPEILILNKDNIIYVILTFMGKDQVKLSELGKDQVKLSELNSDFSN